MRIDLVVVILSMVQTFGYRIRTRRKISKEDKQAYLHARQHCKKQHGKLEHLSLIGSRRQSNCHQNNGHYCINQVTRVRTCICPKYRTGVNCVNLYL